jgi:hypothetical protein
VMTLLGEYSWWPWRRSAPQSHDIPVRT